MIVAIIGNGPCLREAPGEFPGKYVLGMNGSFKRRKCDGVSMGTYADLKANILDVGDLPVWTSKETFIKWPPTEPRPAGNIKPYQFGKRRFISNLKDPKYWVSSLTHNDPNEPIKLNRTHDAALIYAAFIAEHLLKADSIELYGVDFGPEPIYFKNGIYCAHYMSQVGIPWLNCCPHSMWPHGKELAASSSGSRP